ncbi:MAG: hypothetical protein ACWGOY_05255 [Anaerolineales bacterium]
MRKTIWIPLVLGGVLGLLDFVSLAVNFLIPLGPFGATGPQEILVMMAAALGGPLGFSVAQIFHDLGIYLYFLNTQLSPGQMASLEVLFALADFSAHILALSVIAWGYKFLHQRAQKIYTFCAGWILIVTIYYTLLALLQSLLIGLVVQVKHPLSELFWNNLPEFLVGTLITTLILVALPNKYRKPLWIKQQRLPSTPADEAMSREIQW